MTCGEQLEYTCDDGYYGVKTVETGESQSVEIFETPDVTCLASGDDDQFDEGFHGFYGRVSGFCKPNTCSRDAIQVFDNSWQAVFVEGSLDENEFFEDRYVDFSTSRDFQWKSGFDVGDIAVHECFDDFSAVYDDGGENSGGLVEIDQVAAKKDEGRLELKCDGRRCDGRFQCFYFETVL